MLDGFGIAPVSVVFDLDSYDGPWTHVHRFRDRSGWLMVAEARLECGDEWMRTTLVAACDEWGEPVPGFMAPNLLACACSHPQPCHEEPPEALDDILCEEEGALIVRWQRETNRDLAELAESVERRIAAIESATRRFIDAGERQVAELRRRRRMPGSTAEARGIFDTIIVDIESEGDAALERLTSRRADIRARAEDAEEALFSRSTVEIEVTPLYTVQWAGSGMRREADLRSLLVHQDAYNAWRAPPSQAKWKAERPQREAAQALRELEERKLIGIEKRKATWAIRRTAKTEATKRARTTGKAA